VHRGTTAATASSPSPASYSESWWYEAFPQVPYEKAMPGEHEMLTLVAYDIADEKRLRRVANLCEDYGIRVQYSIFECRLDERSFAQLWAGLLALIDDHEDRLVAYKIDARSAKETMTAGAMVCSEKVICYLV
jgi:CRISPR-associated protein Cas2